MKKNNYVRISLGFAGFTKDQLNSFLILLLVCLKTIRCFPACRSLCRFAGAGDGLSSQARGVRCGRTD